MTVLYVVGGLMCLVGLTMLIGRRKVSSVDEQHRKAVRDTLTPERSGQPLRYGSGRNVVIAGSIFLIGGVGLIIAAAISG